MPTLRLITIAPGTPARSGEPWVIWSGIMNETLMTTFAVALGTLGVLAEGYLMRSLLREWLERRREERANSFQPASQTRTIQANRSSLAAGWTLIRPGVAACFAVPALMCPMAIAQEASQALPAATLTATPSSFAMAFSQAAPDEPKPKEEQPLTISTNRPSFNDTTGIVPIGHFQLETGYTFTFRNRDGVETQTHNGPEILFRVPFIEDRLELQLGTSGYVYSRSNSGTGFDSVDGFSDMTAGLRLKMTDENGWVPRTAIQLVTTLGTGSDDISNQDVEPVLKLIWSYDLGQGWSIYGNAGVGYLTSGGDHFTQGQGGVCVGYTINDKWSVYGEYYMFGPNSKGTDAAHYVDFGAAYLVTPRMQLDARVGFGLNEEANNLFTGMGISFLF